MFAVTGITGQVGGVVAATLLEEGLPVRAIVRDARKGEAWRQRGAEIAVADMSDGEALARAFADVEAVFLLIPPHFDPSEGFPEVRKLIPTLKDALMVAKPKRVVCLSTVGAQAREFNLLTQLGIVEQSLSELSNPITFLRAGWFIENTLWDIPDAREKGEIASFLQPLDRPIPMVAVDDIGKLAAKLLQEQWTGVRVVELEGPERVAPDDIAKALSDILGRPVHAKPVPRNDWEAIFRRQGMKNPTPRMRMIDGFNEGWIDFEGGRTNSVKGTTDLKSALQRLVERA